MRRVKVKINGVRVTGVISDDVFICMDEVVFEGSAKSVSRSITETFESLANITSRAIRVSHNLMKEE